MLFALLTIFTADNAGQLTRQSISWGASTLCWWGGQASIRPVPCAVPSFHWLQQAEYPGLSAWAASNTQRSHEGALSVTLVSLCPLALREKAATYSSFLSLNTPLGPLGFALGQTSRVQSKKTGGGGEEASLKLSILHPEMGGKSVVLLQGISCYKVFHSLWPTVALRKVVCFSFPCHPWGVHYCKW